MDPAELKLSGFRVVATPTGRFTQAGLSEARPRCRPRTITARRLLDKMPVCVLI